METNSIKVYELDIERGRLCQLLRKRGLNDVVVGLEENHGGKLDGDDEVGGLAGTRAADKVVS